MNVKDNEVLISIGLFIVIFALIQWSRPLFLFKSDGSIRQFGVGYKNKTIFPIWIMAIVLGILIYTLVIGLSKWF
jgi:hypothetical protein